MDFPDVIKFRVAAHMISEKAIQFWHPDNNPDRAQKLISSSMSRHLSTRNISSKCTRFWVILLRQTDRQLDERGQTHLPPPLSEVNNACLVYRMSLQVLIYPKVTATDEKSLKSYQEYKNGPVVGLDLIDWWVKLIVRRGTVIDRLCLLLVLTIIIIIIRMNVIATL